MSQAVHEAVLVVCVWVVLNQWSIWELIEREGRKPTRKRRHKAQASGEPKPFPGLAQKPVCDECEKEGQGEACEVAAPPKMVSGRGRPAAVDTSRQFCPNEKCCYYGRVGWGNIVANGHPGGGLWRQFHCKACGCWFLETHGTIFFGRRAVVPMVLLVLAALMEGLGIRAAGRVFGLDPNTVERWLVAAARQMKGFAAYVLVDLELEQVQLDEILVVLGHLLEAGTGSSEVRASSNWLWTAMDPVSKLLLVMVVGDHSLAVAQAVVHQVKRRLAVHCLPVFLTDGLAHYKLALLTHFGRWALAGEGAVKARWFPVAGLVYAQVIKTMRRGRLVLVKQRLVFGSLEEVRARLGRRGWKINTAFVERLNLTIRQHVAALGRRVLTRAQSPVGLSHQALLFLVYYNFCLAHASLRLPLGTPQATRGTGSPRRWQERTPAMAAGLTDHIWTLREVLLYRVPPVRPAQLVA
jgi:IS1 family transposase